MNWLMRLKLVFIVYNFCLTESHVCEISINVDVCGMFFVRISCSRNSACCKTYITAFKVAKAAGRFN